MANIIPFPSKNIFRAQFEGKIPDPVLNDLLSAYDRVLLLKDKYPAASFRVASGYENDAKTLAEDYQNYTLLLLKRILELEAELCLSKKP
ncbi:MAG: hypothetical protein VR73_07610 [Gammaproteobacteria bacterium BRH_c0]|nr:MAG: hypothetical protein VR73_08400 [Gammaproteobacteria bacterium BRH_c0]KJS07896.1 MAG: hypothetical protein VR73_07610 [Gammaproteobacteria bacterium BRH_c0]